MIKIKLNDLLSNHKISITDFSKDTGLARSTITPLVNKPDEVKAIKIETINVICDYFGILVDELIEFIPDSIKYLISAAYDSERDDRLKFMLFKKNMGNSERYSLVAIRFQQVYYGEDFPDGVIEAEISVLGDETDLPYNVDKFIDPSKIIPSSVFLKDFKRQPDEKKVTTTEIIAKAILSIPPLSDYAILRQITLTWSDFPFLEKPRYSFEILKNDNNLRLIYNDGLL